MKLKGETTYISQKSGTSKTGKDYFVLKFLDEEAEEFFSCFVTEEMFRQFEVVGKNTTVTLTLNLVPGSKFFELQSADVFED